MKIVVVLFLLISPLFSNSQILSPEITTSAWDSYKKINAQMDWSLGEIATDTYINNQLILTQGFQQGHYYINKVIEIKEENLIVNVFPNPATDFVNIEIKNSVYNNYQINVMSQNGAVIFTRNN